jgi:carbamoyltransferase
LATAYSRTTEALGFAPEGDEHRFEALARIGEGSRHEPLGLLQYRGDHLGGVAQLGSTIASQLSSLNRDRGVSAVACMATCVQDHLGRVLVEIVSAIKARFASQNLCLAGGLFFNSFLNTCVAESGVFAHTYVPINPGNAGVAVGAALAAAGGPAHRAPEDPFPSFLGPEYQADAIKATLDNCKSSYDYASNGQLIDRTVSALTAGKLVGWFQGRMEWGPRALGNRSILASPLAPYTLDNLNLFLKRREPHRSYSVSISAEDVGRYFRGPAASDHMQYDYDVRDRRLFQSVLPFQGSRLRVQTVTKSCGVFYDLLKTVGDLSGVPMLVNTSFNGFNEPIVCTPRDAIRVFYGTGLDMVVLGNFILQK